MEQFTSNLRNECEYMMERVYHVISYRHLINTVNKIIYENTGYAIDRKDYVITEVIGFICQF